MILENLWIPYDSLIFYRVFHIHSTNSQERKSQKSLKRIRSFVEKLSLYLSHLYVSI